MRSILSSFAYGVLASCAIYASILPASYAQENSEPIELLEQTAGQILQQLNERRDEFTAQPSLLRAIIRQDLIPLIDMEYSSRLILGRSGREVTETQLGAFSEAMSSVLINRYADGLLQFKSQDQMEILPLRGKNTDRLTRVRTRIKLPNGGHAPIDYAFHKTDQGWKAFDVTVEGISYVITFRNQIAPRVAEVGIDRVTADLSAGNLRLND